MVKEIHRRNVMAQENTDKNTNLSQVEDYLSSIEFENALAHDDGRAAKQHLAAGRPIYYGDERFPEGLIKKYPDGHRQIVSVDPDGRITVIRDL
jgi:hypothetical protein